MKSKTSKGQERSEGQVNTPGRRVRAALTGGWPATWNWGTIDREEPPRRRAIRDLHGDYSEQTGAFFG